MYRAMVYINVLVINIHESKFTKERLKVYNVSEREIQKYKKI